MSVPAAPDYAVVRIVTAADSGVQTDRDEGVNFAEYGRGHVQVVPSSNSNPTVRILVWSDVAEAFVVHKAFSAQSGEGAGVAFEFDFAAEGRIAYPQVTGTVGDGVTIYMSQYTPRY